MDVWHGSDTFIEKIDLDKCKYGRDFGRGFYVTKLHDQAKDMAQRVAHWNKTQPIVTSFEFDEFVLLDPGMKILRFDGYNDAWLDFVVLNRKNKSALPAHDYDIVEGPVADDRITRQINDFIAGTLSREQFMKELMYFPSHQMCFCTAQSLQALTPPLAKQRIESHIYHIDDDVVQALMGEYGLPELEATDMYYTSKTYALVAEESTGYYQKPWREIYEMLLAELEI